MEDIAGRTAFITGGAQGIGLGIARALAAEGAVLALADIDETALAEAKAALVPQTKVETFVLDVRERERFVAVADQAEAALGPISILCNNAGVAGRSPVDDMSYEMWDWVLGINLGGVVNGLQTFLPRMIERGPGHVVNTASGAGLAVLGAAGGAGFLYHGSKYAVVGISEALHGELAQYGIGVSVLCPGPVATNIQDTTPRTRPSSGYRPPGDFVEQRKAILAQGATPEAVGRLVLDAVRANQLFVHTDRIMAKAVQARTEQILAAMPPA